MLSYTKHGIIVIHRTGPHGEIQAVHTMRYIYVLNLPVYITSLDVIGLKVGHRHHHDVRLQLHHKRNQLFFTDIIWSYPRLLLGKFKHRIFEITCNIMDYQIGILQQIFYHSFIILVKSTALGVEHKMLIHH